MSSFIQTLLCNSLTLSLKAIEFIVNKSCLVCCQCMKRFPGCFWIIVRIIILLFFISISICLAFISYAILYWLLIPSLHYEWPIYFDFTEPLPSAIINVDQEYEWYLLGLPFESIKQHQASLKPNEFYDISVNLHIPSKQSMHDLGNVMLKLSLYQCPFPSYDDANKEENGINVNSDNKNKNGHNDTNNNDKKDTRIGQFRSSLEDKYVELGWTLLRKSARPILLKYESTLIRIIKKIICIIPYCLGLWNEDKYLSIPLMTGFNEKFDHPTCAAIIQLSTNKFNIYDASIYFDIQLGGIKYLLYHWWLTSSVFTVFVFTFICCIVTSPVLTVCCYQVNKVKDCYNHNQFESDDTDYDQDDETENLHHNAIYDNHGDDDDSAPISLLNTNINDDNNNNDNTNNKNESRSSSLSSTSSTSSSLLMTASPSKSRSSDDQNDGILINQTGLRRRKRNNEGGDESSNY